MAETIGAGVILLLAVYGCVQGVRWAVLWLLSPLHEADGVWLLPVSGHCEEIEYRVRCAATQRSWNSGFCGEVCVLDAGADEETRALAQRVCREVRGTRLLTCEELPSFLAERVK